MAVDKMAKPRKSKSTKKFEKNHLKDTIDRRKDFAKVKQRHQVKAKKQQRAADRDAKDAPQINGDEDNDVAEGGIVDMNNDQFFQDELRMQEPGSGRGNKASRDGVPLQTGKRKRVAEEIETPAEIVDREDFGGFSDSASNSEATSAEVDDLMDHKDQLNALAEKDPEFYKYLQENDADLLDFEGDLAAIDGVDEGNEEEERTVKKAKTSRSDTGMDLEKDQTVEVSIAVVQKWKNAMVEQHSVRALRQMVLAFRAAARVHDEEARNFKYAIPNSEIYHEILVTALKHVPTVLTHHCLSRKPAQARYE